MVVKIAAVTEQQTTTADEIAQNIAFIDTVASETETATRNIADSSSELSKMAHALAMKHRNSPCEATIK